MIEEKEIKEVPKTDEVKVSFFSKLMFWKKKQKSNPDGKSDSGKKSSFNWKFWEKKEEKIDYVKPIEDSSKVFEEKYKLLEQKKVNLSNSVNIADRKILIAEIEALKVEVKDLRENLEDLVKEKTKVDFVVEEEKKEREVREGAPR